AVRPGLPANPGGATDGAESARLRALRRRRLAGLLRCRRRRGVRLCHERHGTALAEPAQRRAAPCDLPLHLSQGLLKRGAWGKKGARAVDPKVAATRSAPAP